MTAVVEVHPHYRHYLELSSVYDEQEDENRLVVEVVGMTVRDVVECLEMV